MHKLDDSAAPAAPGPDFAPGDIITAHIPFVDRPDEGKFRPCLVLQYHHTLTKRVLVVAIGTSAEHRPMLMVPQWEFSIGRKTETPSVMEASGLTKATDFLLVQPREIDAEGAKRIGCVHAILRGRLDRAIAAARQHGIERPLRITREGSGRS